MNIQMHTRTPNTVVGMVCYLWRNENGFPEIYLAPKNPSSKSLERGLADKMNGYGGGMEKEDGGSLFVGTAREILQESGVIIEESVTEKVAEIFFVNTWGNYFCHFLLAKKFSGDPRPSQEMGIGKWFPFHLDSMPFDKMMDSDKRILPEIIAGKKFKATIIHDKNMMVTNFEIEYVDHF